MSTYFGPTMAETPGGTPINYSITEDALRTISNMKDALVKLKTQLNALEYEISIKETEALQFDTTVVMGKQLQELHEQNRDLKEEVRKLQAKLARFESQQVNENDPMNRPPLRQLDFSQGWSTRN